MLFLLGFAVIPAMMQVRVAPEDVEPDYERDDERADGAHCAHEGTGACEQHRDKAKHGGHAVQHRDSLLLIEAEREEPVMEMPLVGMERALPWIIRRKKAKVVSARGTASASSGTRKVIMAWNLNMPRMETVDSTKPRS